MKIVFINPPGEQGVNKNARLRTPLGLAYLAAIAQKEGCEAKIFDLSAKPESYSDDLKADFVVVTTSPMDRWETPYLSYEGALKIVKEAKAAGATTILTGPHGSISDRRILKNCPELDVIMRGEAEYTFRDIIRGKNLDEVKGISFGRGDSFKKNPNRELITELDELPFPAYELLDLSPYKYTASGKDFPQPFTIIESSRGCPADCVFCLKVMHGGRNYRVRSPENVVAELEILVNKHGIKSFYFQDLEFTINRKRVHGICDLMIEKGIKLVWACASRLTDMDDELMAKMAKAGCSSISFGVESLSPEILKKIKKCVPADAAGKVHRMCKKHGINFNAFYTQGHVGECNKTMEESLKNAIKHRVPHPLKRGAKIIPYPGTQLYDMAKEEGLIKDDGNWAEVGELAGKVGAKPVKYTLKSLLYFSILRLFRISKK